MLDSRCSNRIVLRPFQPDDQEAARRLILDGLEEHWGSLDLSLNPDLEDISAHYAGGIFLVAHLDAELVGTGALVDEAPGASRIVRMSVKRSHRRLGIGRLILEQLLEAARKKSCHKVVLETTQTWEDAVAFYIRNGFRPIGLREGDVHFEMEVGEASEAKRTALQHG